MGDLNLDFDMGTKSVSLSDTLSDNLGFSKSNSDLNLDLTTDNTKPSLNISDGVELLAKGQVSPVNSDGGKSDKDSKKSEDFSFFKSDPVEDKGGIVDGDMKNISVNNDDNLLLSNPNPDSGYKPIHRLTAQEIKNEKIDLIYKFKKLEGQGIRTTMNYNMNSHLEDMRNEYIKLKKQREIDNAVKFQRKMLMACVTGILQHYQFPFVFLI